ncbi:MAG: cytochrome b/b6 domain-containing protein [Gammaproteobacteria bacterium]
MTTVKKTVKVWDPIVRIGHWILAIAFFTAYLTEDDWLTQHVWAGYLVGAVVLIRVIWGFIGSRHARFGNFVRRPGKTLLYFKNLITGKPQHYIGHNPAGGLMVLALLASLAGTTLTGLKLYAVEENKGPLAVAMQSKSEGFESGFTVDKEAEEIWEELHETFANLTLFLVFLHVGGVVASSIVDRENLVKAMLTGKKKIDDTYK